MSVKWLRLLRETCPILADRAEELNEDDGFVMYQSKKKIKSDTSRDSASENATMTTAESCSTPSFSQINNIPRSASSLSVISDLTHSGGTDSDVSNKKRKKTQFEHVPAENDKSTDMTNSVAKKSKKVH
jgi:hypothetical protein